MALRNEKGLTLMEIMISIVVLGIMGALGIQFVSQAARVDQMHTERLLLVNNARFALEALVREMRYAVPASVVTTATSVTFDKQFAYPQDATTTGITYTYNPGTQVLQRTGATTSTVATNVTAFTITNNGGLYTFDITTSGTQGGTFRLISAVRPRTP